VLAPALGAHAAAEDKESDDEDDDEEAEDDADNFFQGERVAPGYQGNVGRLAAVYASAVTCKTNRFLRQLNSEHIDTSRRTGTSFIS
jgi:hypothetical protein